MIVNLIGLDSDGNDYNLGTLTPPTVNGKPIYTDDPAFSGKQTPDGKPVSVIDALDDLYEQWRKIDPHPDSHSQFADWLVAEHGWEYLTENLVTWSVNI